MQALSVQFELRSVSGGGRRCSDHDGAGSLGPRQRGGAGGGRSVRPGPGPPGAAASRQVGGRGPRGGGPTACSLAFASGGAALRSVDSPWRGGGGDRRTPRGGWRGPRGIDYSMSQQRARVTALVGFGPNRAGGAGVAAARRGLVVDSRRGGLRDHFAGQPGVTVAAVARVRPLLRCFAYRAAATAPR